MFNKYKKVIPIFLLLMVFLLVIVTIDITLALRIRTIVDSTINGELDHFTRNAMIYIGIVLLYFPTNLLFNMVKGRFIKTTLKSMKSNYVKRVFNKNINEFQKENNSLYLSSLTNDFNLIEQNLLEPTIDVLSSLFFFAAGVILISLVNPLILLVALGVTLINILLSMVTSRPVNKHNKHRSELFSSYTSYIKEVLSAFHIIKTNNLVDKVKKDFESKSELVQHKGYVIDKIITIVSAVQQTNFSLTFYTLMITVGFMAFSGDITLGGVILIVQSSDKLVWPLMQFSEALPKMFSVKSLFTRIDETLKNHENHIETEAFVDFKAIHVKGVSFGYDDTDVLSQVDMTFNKGGKYLIVGPSGGGKSTVLKLLRKYYNPREGEILIDHMALKDIKKESYFANIANIEQQVFLFEDTIRNNLTLYKEYSDEEIQMALEKSGLVDFIAALPKGLDNMIYDNGNNISGGERSRIAIARGLLNKAQIIFLDEAFASLDFEKAKSIESIILSLKDVTVINVSHVVFDEHKSQYDGVYVVKNKTVMC